jgi:acid phosphatase (class A)
MKHLANFAAAFVLAAAPLRAQTPILLTPEQYAPLNFIAAPPAPGSAQARAELAEIKRVQAAASPARMTAAAWDDRHEDLSVFLEAMGAQGKALPATGELIHVLIKNESRAASAAKKAFKRDRPWVVDASIKTCTPHAEGIGSTSYPSGHASVGYAMAGVLTSLMPAKAKAINARADVFAESRIVCGYHFRSDITAGKTLGTLVATNLLRSPGFKPYYEAAKAELKAANLAR